MKGSTVGNLYFSTLEYRCELGWLISMPTQRLRLLGPLDMFPKPVYPCTLSLRHLSNTLLFDFPASDIFLFELTVY